MVPRCTGAKREGELFGELCRAPATHRSVLGPRCTPHAETLRQALRNPNTLGNVIAGRARTEEEIARLVVAIQ